MRRTCFFIYLLALTGASALSGSWRYQERPEGQHALTVSDGRPQFPEWPRPASLALFRPDPRRPQTGFVALGDSYSAGIGTGVDGPEDDCRHGLHGYPALIARDFEASQGGGRGRNDSVVAFQFLSCTGSTTEEILSGGAESQLDNFNTSLPADFALLSVGGNDLGFFEVMNACIFRFYNFYSGTCETALQHAQERLEGDEFEQRLQIVILELLDKVRWEKKPWFLITVTGYARFFNDQTAECDEMSLGVWWQGPKLKRELRVRMNAMVQAVNQKIESTVALINSRFTSAKVLFVDYDKQFDSHRFCEPGVQEPDYSRNDTWFFLVGGPDNARNNVQGSRFAQAATVPAKSDFLDPDTCLEPAARSGDWGVLALCYMAMSKAQDPTLKPARDEFMAQNSMWYVPTYYGKTFHPRTRGHEAIRDMIYETWAKLEK
ncbi:hypothetical protein JX266_012495 [Neoarthrinium moseri]|nr:hypothetical protein JX266_012495 [Neoarthrinium moseri]